MIFFLLACGAGDTLDQPLPPPDPPAQLTSADPGLIRQTGLVSDVHSPTRTFVLTGEGRRSIVHLATSGTLRLGAQPVLIEELKAGTTLWVEGKRTGDLLVTERASDSPDWDAKIAAPAADNGPPNNATVEPAADPAAPAEPAPVEPAAPAAPAAPVTP
jgi:hypothetical protein